MIKIKSFLIFIILLFPIVGKPQFADFNENFKDSLSKLNVEIANSSIDNDAKILEYQKIYNQLKSIDSSKYTYIPLREISQIYFKEGKNKEALAIEHLIKKISKKYNNHNIWISAINSISILHYRLGNNDSTLYFLKMNYDYFSQLSDTTNLDKEIKYYKLANLNSLGLYFNRNKEYDKALKYFNQLENFALTNKDTSTLITVYANKVNVYKNLANTEMMFENANKVLALDPNNINVNNELGLYYKRTKDYETALKYFNKVLENGNTNNHYLVAAIKNNIGIVYNLMLKPKLSIPYLLEAKTAAENANSSNYLSISYQELSDAYEMIGDYKKALELHKLHKELEDSLNDIELKERIAGLENSIELKEKESELQISETEKQLKEQELQAKNKQILIAGISIICFLLILIYVIYINSKLKITKTALEQSNRTKDRFFSIIAHDLRSPIIALQGIGKRLTKHITNNNIERVERLAPELDKSLSNVNFLLDNLLSWAVSQQGSIPLKIENISVKDLIAEVVSTSESEARHKGLEIKIEADEMQVVADYNSLCLILRNLLSNAIKFSPENGVVSIVAKNGSQKSIEIIDQGKGINIEQLEKINKAIYFSDAQKEGEKGFGIGLSLVKEFAKLNKLQLKINSEINKGSQFSIMFN